MGRYADTYRLRVSMRTYQRAAGQDSLSKRDLTRQRRSFTADKVCVAEAWRSGFRLHDDKMSGLRDEMRPKSVSLSSGILEPVAANLVLLETRTNCAKSSEAAGAGNSEAARPQCDVQTSASAPSLRRAEKPRLQSEQRDSEKRVSVEKFRLCVLALIMRCRCVCRQKRFR